MEKYKHLKYEIDNLMFLCAQCHTDVDSNPSDRVIEETEKAKKRFNIK